MGLPIPQTLGMGLAFQDPGKLRVTKDLSSKLVNVSSGSMLPSIVLFVTLELAKVLLTEV